MGLMYCLHGCCLFHFIPKTESPSAVSDRDPSLQHQTETRTDLCAEPCNKWTLGPLPAVLAAGSDCFFWFGAGRIILGLFCLCSLYWGGYWSLLLILSPVQINREHRNINKTKLDTASLRFPPLQGPCGSWAQAVKGGNCAATAISYPMAKAEFLRPWLRVWQGKWCLLWSFCHCSVFLQS